jgi:hypothetical protein
MDVFEAVKSIEHEEKAEHRVRALAVLLDMFWCPSFNPKHSE